MTQSPPPGWYPDPGQTSNDPRTERWWDGTAWTDRIRRPAGGPADATAPPAGPPSDSPAEVPSTSPAEAPSASATETPSPASPAEAPPAGTPPVPPPTYAPYAGYAPHPPPAPQGAAPRRRLRTAVAVGVTVAVLAGIGGGVYALTSDDGDGGGDDSARRPSASAPPTPEGDGRTPETPGTPTPGFPGGPSQAPPTEDGYATDLASGISLPVPDGWSGETGPGGAGAQVSVGPYRCPGDPSQSCLRGGASSAPAEALKIDATTPKAAARADIAKNAEDSYGSKAYGKLTGHKQLAAKETTVAGQKGYLVRWKVTTAKGDDGYVQSLAFRSPADKSTLVVVRFGFDIDDKAPKLSVMDEITKGIKSAPGGGGGGGTEV